MFRNTIRASAASRGRWAALVALLVLALVAPTANLTARADGATTTTGVPVDTAIADVWGATDGPVADRAASRAWLWGPRALARAVEYYEQSPTGLRTMVYYDKGRLDILNPQGDPGSPWHVTGAALVTEMLTGQIQFGEKTFVTRAAPAIPIIGDPGTPAPTYAQLARLAFVGQRPLADSGQAGPAPARVGEPIHALLAPDGTAQLDGAPAETTPIGAYDDVVGHNIAAPFADWARTQAPAYPANWLLGRPLTEPFWVDATIAGTAKRVLVQAFERRILTYTPGNPEGWRVESANVGLHYRAWRGLVQPQDAGLVSLASFEASGEELVAAATATGVDPFLLVALSGVASGGDPNAVLPNGGQGLLGVRPQEPEAAGRNLNDPGANAAAGAAILARLSAGLPDQRAALTTYFGAVDALSTASLVDRTLTLRDELDAKHPIDYAPPPAPVAEARGGLIASGPAAYYSPNYDVGWWDNTLARYAGWGGAAAGWTPDPNGYYCVRPGFIPGQRLALDANGVTITCTIGDTVAQQDLSQWLAKWAVELNWEAFAALGLPGNNAVAVYAVGS